MCTARHRPAASRRDEHEPHSGGRPVPDGRPSLRPRSVPHREDTRRGHRRPRADRIRPTRGHRRAPLRIAPDPVRVARLVRLPDVAAAHAAATRRRAGRPQRRPPRRPPARRRQRPEPRLGRAQPTARPGRTARGVRRRAHGASVRRGPDRRGVDERALRIRLDRRPRPRRGRCRRARRRPQRRAAAHPRPDLAAGADRAARRHHRPPPAGRRGRGGRHPAGVVVRPLRLPRGARHRAPPCAPQHGDPADRRASAHPLRRPPRA